MYLQRRIQLRASDDQGFNNKLLDVGSSLERISELDDFSEVFSGSIKLTGPVTDTEIPLSPGLSSGRILYIKSNKEIVIKLDATTDSPITVKPPQTGVDATFYLEGDFSAIYFSYTGSDELGLFYAVVGD